MVEREEPNLERDSGEQRQCKWCGRLSSRVKDTEAGPLCGVCQLNTATATRLNKDPYAQTGTKVSKQVRLGWRSSAWVSMGFRSHQDDVYSLSGYLWGRGQSELGSWASRSGLPPSALSVVLGFTC